MEPRHAIGVVSLGLCVAFSGGVAAKASTALMPPRNLSEVKNWPDAKNRPDASMHLEQSPLIHPQSQEADSIRIEQVARNVYAVWPSNRHVKVVIAEFATFLALIEAPYDERTVREILSELRARFPAKPVRYVFHSHHHDHSMHVVDPFLALGIQIVTSPFNLNELCKVSADPSLLRSRALVIDSTFELADATNRLRVDLLRQGDGETGWTVPTREYMVFVFPDQRALVSGCLYNKPLGYHEVVNIRKHAMRKYLETCTTPITTIIPTNTSSDGGFEDICTRDMLAETMVMGLDPNAVVARLEVLTLDALRASAPALREEFKSLPRSFDLQVCANGLASKGFREHCVVLLEVATELFPDDGSAWYQLGLWRWRTGDEGGATTAWDRSIACETSDEDRRQRMDSIRQARLATAR
jgi:hypothetical protein